MTIAASDALLSRKTDLQSRNLGRARSGMALALSASTLENKRLPGAFSLATYLLTYLLNCDVVRRCELANNLRLVGCSTLSGWAVYGAGALWAAAHAATLALYGLEMCCRFKVTWQSAMGAGRRRERRMRNITLVEPVPRSWEARSQGAKGDALNAGGKQTALT